LIGLNARVSGKIHSGYNCQGEIVDETKNTLQIKTAKDKKIVPKNAVLLELKIPKNCQVRVDGKLLVSRSEDRIKKKYRIKFV